MFVAVRGAIALLVVLVEGRRCVSTGVRTKANWARCGKPLATAALQQHRSMPTILALSKHSCRSALDDPPPPRHLAQVATVVLAPRATATTYRCPYACCTSIIITMPPSQASPLSCPSRGGRGIAVPLRRRRDPGAEPRACAAGAPASAPLGTGEHRRPTYPAWTA